MSDFYLYIFFVFPVSVCNWAIVAIWSLLFVNKYTPLVGVYYIGNKTFMS